MYSALDPAEQHSDVLACGRSVTCLLPALAQQDLQRQVLARLPGARQWAKTHHTHTACPYAWHGGLVAGMRNWRLLRKKISGWRPGSEPRKGGGGGVARKAV